MAFVIGISGATRSGKSTLAKALVEHIGSTKTVVLSQDSFASHALAAHHESGFEATESIDHAKLRTAIYRRRWGCETALQGARLRLSRAYLAAGGDARHARGAARTTFDPGDADHFAAAASPVLRGLPAGQRD